MLAGATGRRRKTPRELYRLYFEFVSSAADLLKSGNRNAPFPIGSFPPHLPFVRELP
jgi:hypothetical protein